MGAEGKLEPEVQIGESSERGSVLPARLAAAQGELDEAIGASRLAPEVQALIERMMDGSEPLDRPLKSNEVLRLNPRHINMIVLRAAGFKASEISQITGFDQTGIYPILSHPYAKKLVRELQFRNGGRVIDIKTRLDDYASELLDHTFGLAMKSEELDVVSKVTFGMLDRVGFAPKEGGAKKDGEKDLSMPEGTMKRLMAAMEGSRSVDQEVMPTWTPRRPPEEAFDTPESAEDAEPSGGADRGEVHQSSGDPGSQRVKGVA